MPYVVISAISAVLASDNVSVQASDTGSYACQHNAGAVRVVATAPFRVHVAGWAGTVGDTSVLIPADTPTLLRHPGPGKAVSFYNDGNASVSINVAEVDV